MTIEEALKYLKFLSEERCECEVCQYSKKVYKTVLNYIKKQRKERTDYKAQIRLIRDKAEVMDYYTLNDVIDDLSKLIGDYKEDDE